MLEKFPSDKIDGTKNALFFPFTCARVSFLIKLQVWGLQLSYQTDFGTGVFL